MASLLYVSNAILNVVSEVYIVKDSGMVICYRIDYKRFLIIIYNLSKGVRLCVVLTK